MTITSHNPGLVGSLLAAAASSAIAAPALAQLNISRWAVAGGGQTSSGGGLTVGGGFWPAGAPACYANCDGSTGAPVLNVNDFICFQARFASNDPYADCDHNQAFNVNDFICFQGQFAAGCS